MNQKEFPEAIEMEKQLLSAMFMKEGLVVPVVAAIIDATFTTARAKYHSGIIKEKATLRKLIDLSDIFINEAQRGKKFFSEILAYAESHLSSWSRHFLPSDSSYLADYFANHLKADIDSLCRRNSARLLICSVR